MLSSCIQSRDRPAITASADEFGHTSSREGHLRSFRPDRPAKTPSGNNLAPTASRDRSAGDDALREASSSNDVSRVTPAHAAAAFAAPSESNFGSRDAAVAVAPAHAASRERSPKDRPAHAASRDRPVKMSSRGERPVCTSSRDRLPGQGGSTEERRCVSFLASKKRDELVLKTHRFI